jgi:riboflavin synthase
MDVMCYVKLLGENDIMFTGIIDHCGVITEIEKKQQAYQLKIQTNFTDLILGESIAVEGVCLTVTDTEKNSFFCDISPETLRVTSADNFKTNRQVNLERALQLNSRLGGHMVAGHIDQTAKIESISQINEFTQLVCSDILPENMPYLIKKGSIAINGVSLTINEVTSNGFTVMLIPHTLTITTLSELKTNETINIEFDMIAKMIFEQTQKYKQL